MATLDAIGIEGLILSMEELSQLPNAVVDDMLLAGGELLANGHRASLSAKGLIKSGALKSSVKVHLKTKDRQHYVLIYPDGKHHTYRKRSYSYTKYNWGRAGATKQTSSGIATATANDVGFVHEFGGHGNRATQWMREANEKYMGKAIEAEEKVYDQWLKSLGL